MARKRKPRSGSLAFKPQKRASRLHATLDNVKDVNSPEPLGFAAYKAGMTRVLRIEDRENSEFKGQEVADAVTLLECPPIKVHGVRLYRETRDGEEVFTDILETDAASPHLEKKLGETGSEKSIDDIEDHLDDLSRLKLLVHTQPHLTTIGRKKPDVFELPLGGSVQEQYEAVQDMVGDEIRISDVFEDGEYLDAIGITKGRGFEGPVRRHGIKPLPTKSQKIKRKAGNLGPWHPDHTSWKVPQAGQQGNARRTEHNKRLLKIGDDPEEITPDGGIKKYGELRNDYIMIKGSVPGPAKRLIMLRSAIRKQNYPSNPDITHIET